jgi:hypothetical protein
MDAATIRWTATPANPPEPAKDPDPAQVVPELETVAPPLKPPDPANAAVPFKDWGIHPKTIVYGSPKSAEKSDENGLNGALSVSG